MNVIESEYEALRKKANSFVNKNWWWLMLACLGVGIVLGLWNPLGIGK